MSYCRALIAGGGAPEIEVAVRLQEHSLTLTGMEQYCFRGFAEAMNVIPFTLAENAGLNPIATVTELRNRHARGDKTYGINVRKVRTTAFFNAQDDQRSMGQAAYAVAVVVTERAILIMRRVE